jgi:hypothetical protein
MQLSLSPTDEFLSLQQLLQSTALLVDVESVEQSSNADGHDLMPPIALGMQCMRNSCHHIVCYQRHKLVVHRSRNVCFSCFVFVYGSLLELVWLIQGTPQQGSRHVCLILFVSLSCLDSCASTGCISRCKRRLVRKKKRFLSRD